MTSQTETGNIQRVVAATPDMQLRAQIQRRIAMERDRLRHPGLSLERLTRFVENSRAPNTLLSQWDRAPGLLGTLLQALDVDSSAVEWLIDDPDSFDAIRLAAGRDPSSIEIHDRLLAEVRCLDDIGQLHAALKRFRRREWLRVVFGVELHGMRGSWAQQQLTDINDAIIAAAFEFVVLAPHRSSSHGTPAIAVLAHGAYGSENTDFATVCELMCVSIRAPRDTDPRDGLPQDDEEGLRRIERFKEVLESFDPSTLVVDFPLHRLYPEDQERRALDMQRWLLWAHSQGDAELSATLMPMRRVAGDPAIGDAFVQQASVLLFDRYRSRSEQTSLASFLRKRDRARDALRAHGGPWSQAMVDIARTLHEIETIVLFLQWIHGAQVPEIRRGTTAARIEALARHGCLSDAEYGLLFHAHELARDSQLQLQIQAGCSFTADGLDAGAIEPGALLAVDASTLETLRQETARLQALAKQLRASSLDEHGFGDEADLVLDPNPDPAWAAQVLARYGFQDIARAAALVRDLGVEDFRVLSTRRCRYFLATIAAKLLLRIGQTPTPDRTLENLADTCRSIGAKGVLWEWFSLHQPSMDLYIRLCGTSPYLVGILTSNPGMVDELVDSLMLGRLPTQTHLSRLLDELCRGAQDIDAVVQSFKNAMHLSIGVRDILGKESISETHRTLASVADVCLQQLIESHYNALAQRYGEPTLEDGRPCAFAVAALGKLGNREPNYHSDVTILMVYQGAGSTRPFGPTRHPQTIQNDLFFQQLVQRLSQGVNRLTRHGRLYELKPWAFAPHGTPHLAWPIESLESALIDDDQDDAIARMELLSARCMAGDPEFQARVQQSIRSILVARPWSDEDTHTALEHRGALERSASSRNIKRGRGGTLDVETVAQVLSLSHAAQHPELASPCTIDAIERLRRLDIITPDDALRLKDAYNFLRGVESGLRLMNTKARHDLPEEAIDLARLAFGLHIPNTQQLIESCQYYRDQARELLVRYVGDPTRVDPIRAE